MRGEFFEFIEFVEFIELEKNRLLTRTVLIIKEFEAQPLTVIINTSGKAQPFRTFTRHSRISIIHAA
jgi:hypothetical protein